MRRVLGTLLLTTLLLAGCSDGDDGDEAEDPAPSTPGSSERPSETTAPSDDWRLVEIVHETAAGGQVSARPGRSVTRAPWPRSVRSSLGEACRRRS